LDAPDVALRPSSNLTTDQKKAAQDEVLMREIDDAVRQQEYSDLATRYGKPAIAALVLGLAAFGGYLVWDNYREGQLETQSEQFVGALDRLEAGNLDTASTALDPLIARGDASVVAFARMLKAGIAMEQDDPEAAARIYAEVAASDAAPQSIRDLALVREVSARYDRMPAAEVVERLRPLAVPGNAWFGSAGELVAMAYLEQGKRREAGALFAQIAKDEDQPETLRARTRQMAGLLGIDAIDDVDALLEQVNTGAAPEAAAAPAPAQAAEPATAGNE
jgi:hypothetical protein